MYSAMHRLQQSVALILTLVACLAPVTNCPAATNEIDIPNTFTHILLTKQTVADEVAKCLPSVSQEMVSNIAGKFPQSDSITTVQTKDGYFVILNTNGYCIQKSSNDYPILAIEAFYNTANPSKEVPAEVTEKLYKKIAVLIAQKGTAKVAFVFTNGNAMIVDYSVKDAYLLYPHHFKKSGEWESEKIDIKFNDKRMKTFHSTKYDNQEQKKYLLAHRNN